MPDKCDKVGSDCTTSNSGGGTGGTGTGNGTGGTGAGSGTGGDGTGGTGGDGSGGTGGDGSGAVDPLTGAPAGAGVQAGAEGTTGAPGVPLELTGGRSGQLKAAGWVAALVLALTVITPPFLVRRLSRRR
jgi:hypothetical protein